MTKTLRTGLQFLGTSIGLFLVGEICFHPINHYIKKGGLNELGEIRFYAAVLFAVFGLATGLVAAIYLIGAGIEIGGRVLWPGKPPDDSGVE